MGKPSLFSPFSGSAEAPWRGANRAEFLIGGTSLLALSACGGAILSPKLHDLGASTPTRRAAMSLPAGYTTTNSQSNGIYSTNLYYDGSLVATLSLNTLNWETTLTLPTQGTSWTTTSPVGLQPGATWNLATNASGTASSDGNQLSGVLGSSSGYFYKAVDPTTSNYYSVHYHPSFWSSPYRVDTNISSGGTRCTKPPCPLITLACVEAIVGAGFGTIGLIGSGAGIVSGVLTGLAVIAFAAAHLEFIWGVSQIFAHCL